MHANLFFSNGSCVNVIASNCHILLVIIKNLLNVSKTIGTVTISTKAKVQQHRICRCEILFNTDMVMESAVVVASLFFHFSLFREILLWVSCKYCGNVGLHRPIFDGGWSPVRPNSVNSFTITSMSGPCRSPVLAGMTIDTVHYSIACGRRLL